MTLEEQVRQLALQQQLLARNQAELLKMILDLKQFIENHEHHVITSEKYH